MGVAQTPVQVRVADADGQPLPWTGQLWMEVEASYRSPRELPEPAALQRFDRCRSLLQAELGLAPMAETEALAASLRTQAGAPPAPAVAEPVPPDLPDRPALLGQINLPMPLHPLTPEPVEIRVMQPEDGIVRRGIGGHRAEQVGRR